MTNEATERLRQDWDSQANNWYEQRELLLAASRPIHEWMVQHLEPKEGQRVLEIAAGPGDTGFLASRSLGNGRLVSSDIASSMVDAARKRGAELGIENADYEVVDAQSMRFPDATFDGVLCRWGFMLMPDPETAFRECRRVLKPGGRLVFAVFTGPEENPFASVPGRVLAERGHMPPSSNGWQPGILALADPSRVRSLLEAAGLTLLELEGVSMKWTFANTDEFWDFLVDLTALGPRVRSLPDAEREQVRVAIDERLAPFTHAGRIELPSRCWGGVAVR